MPRKFSKQPRKGSYTEGQGRVRYQEKQQGAWRCSVCETIYDHNSQYCLSCYQSLYYFSYINNQLFVAKDDSYLETYFHQHLQQPSEESLSSEGEGSETSNEEVNLDWVESLLM